MASSIDRIQDVFPIVFNFKKGEQPSSTKMTKWVKLEDIAFSRISLAIGDPWDYQTHLNGSSVQYNLSPENLAQASLARIVGPSDYVSPSSAFNESRATDLVVTLSSNRTSWNLGIPLVKVTTPVTAITRRSSHGIAVLTYSDLTFSDTTTFATSKTDLDDVSVAGDFHVDFDRGIITSYSIPTSSSTVTIDSDLHIFGAGAPWTTQNVIPTWADGTQGCTLTLDSISSSSYTYTIDLPSGSSYPRIGSSYNLSGTAGNFTSSSSDSATYTGSTNLASGVPYRLPGSILNNLVSGDSVPEGFCFLWQNSSNTIVASTEFTYDSVNERLNVTCPRLTDISATIGSSSNTSYRLIITGASLSEQVNWLMRAYRDTWHDGLTWGGTVDPTVNFSTPLSHDNLADRFSFSSVGVFSTVSSSDRSRLQFKESLYPTNQHPQYLHRYGYMGSEATGNTSNAMRGDFVLASLADYDFALSIYESNMYETYKISFGGGDTTTQSNNCNIGYIGGPALTTWTSGEADRMPMISGTGANETREVLGGALAYTPNLGVPFYIRGRLRATDDPDYQGGVLAFDLRRNMEGNYIKLLSGIRDGSLDVRHLPANTGQTATNAFPFWPGLQPTTSGGNIPTGSYNRISPEQVREFRFRGVSYVSSSTNPDDSIGGDVLRGSGNDIDEFKDYFTSPGIVGADYINVYGNAIFFSDVGDGSTTSFTDKGEDWLNGTNYSSSTNIDDTPSGLYFVPGTSTVDPYLSFWLHDSNTIGSSSNPFTLGDVHGLRYLAQYGRVTSMTGSAKSTLEGWASSYRTGGMNNILFSIGSAPTGTLIYSSVNDIRINAGGSTPYDNDTLFNTTVNILGGGDLDIGDTGITCTDSVNVIAGGDITFGNGGSETFDNNIILSAGATHTFNESVSNSFYAFANGPMLLKSSGSNSNLSLVAGFDVNYNGGTTDNCINLGAGTSIDFDSGTHQDNFFVASGSTMTIDQNCSDSIILSAGRTINTSAALSRDLYLYAGNDINMDASQNISVTSGSAYDISFNSGDFIYLTASNNISLAASANIDIDSVGLYMNPTGNCILTTGTTMDLDVGTTLTIEANNSTLTTTNIFTVTTGSSFYVNSATTATLDGTDGIFLREVGNGASDLLSPDPGVAGAIPELVYGLATTLGYEKGRVYQAAPSSIRYKEEVEDLEDSSWIYDLRPVSFFYKTQKREGQKRRGLIAEEVHKVQPDLIYYNQDGEIEGVAYKNLIIDLLKEIQEHKKQIDELKSKIESM